MGIQDPLLSWIDSFLTGRYQCVRINNYLSNQFKVPSGVPQGSHSGPLLFLLFTNDISRNLDSSHLLFADDLKIYRTIRNNHDSMALQNDLRKLSNWSYENGLHLNASKCSVITFSRSRNLQHFIYDVNAENLTRSSQVKDLGIFFDNELNFRYHLNIVIGKAFKQLGFILRHSKDFSPNIFKLLYCTYVRPHLEYGSIVWSPHYQTHIHLVERVQEKFLKAYAFKMGEDVSDLDYIERCRLGDLHTLEARRQCQELLFLYKLSNGLVSAPNLLNLLNFNAPCHVHNTRNNNLFRCPFHRTNYGYNSPMSRIQRRFNAYGDMLDLSMPMGTFKKICFNLLK